MENARAKRAKPLGFIAKICKFGSSRSRRLHHRGCFKASYLTHLGVTANGNGSDDVRKQYDWHGSMRKNKCAERAARLF